jgi:hypothetical protein
MPENSAAFWREGFETLCFRFIYFKTGSLTDAQRPFKSYLARNKRMDAYGARDLRASPQIPRAICIHTLIAG